VDSNGQCNSPIFVKKKHILQEQLLSLFLPVNCYLKYTQVYVTNMSTAFEPRLSTSVMRAPLSSADAPSLADSLPSINFGFDELRDRMAKFTVKFDSFIEQGRKRVLEERNQFRMNVAELEGKFSSKSPGVFILTGHQRIKE
jgi:hypothetical protein